MRCKDKEHNEFNFLKSAWCPFSHPMTWEESNHSWYGTAMNRLRVCAITGKTVVWNKKCDCIEEYNSRKSDSERVVCERCGSDNLSAKHPEHSMWKCHSCGYVTIKSDKGRTE